MRMDSFKAVVCLLEVLKEPCAYDLIVCTPIYLSNPSRGL